MALEKVLDEFVEVWYINHINCLYKRQESLTKHFPHH